VFTTARLEPVGLWPGITLWGAAHGAPAGAPNFLDGFSVSPGDVHLALFHGSEQGWLAGQEQGKLLHAPFRADQIGAAGFRYAFLGHYHRPHDGARYSYPGNPDPLTFGEEGERGAVVVDVAEDGAVSRRRTSVAASAVRDVTLDVTGCGSTPDIQGRLRALVGTEPAFVRVTLAGDLDPVIDLDERDLKAAVPYLQGLVVRSDGVRPAYDFEAIAKAPTVQGQFVRDVQAARLGEEQRRRVLVTGLRALAGRDDLEVR
jgi:DNA repair exonuclease SbcCD nuclease subunit